MPNKPPLKRPHAWGDSGKTSRGARLWHCALCGREVQADALPGGECDEALRVAPPSREQLVAMSRKLAELAPGAHFVVCAAFPGARGIESMGNISAELQQKMLRMVLDSFERGVATATAPEAE